MEFSYQHLLDAMNNEIKPYGVKFKVEHEDNTINLLFYNGSYWEDYASGYYEDEVPELFLEAKCYAISVGKHLQKWGNKGNQMFIVVTTSTTRYDDAFNQTVKWFDGEQEAREFFEKEVKGICDNLRQFNKEEEYDNREVICDVNEYEANIVNTGDDAEIWQVNFYYRY